MPDVTTGIGAAALKASAAAGPIAIFVLLVGQMLSGETLAIRVGPTEVGNAMGMAVWFSIGAMIIALIPNILGAMLMGWASARNLGLRHPAAWGLVGAAVMGLPAIAIDGAGSADTAALAAMGALNALVCRMGVRWASASPTV
ncbi:MAG: hypothetical protein E7773_05840 [Sphingomonas sp.]|uniref:hypothetical protein n=1 Tax=Sphingomonas sp. TaxID=28214 RepID=UPI00121ED757|nr:hypothetical protein [Sphingomonas sp.]THD36534.1 MAG: hypothetical protein E7773_05840 [Sphingomonas sp.]